ncbi:GWxTD domain-containing protein [Melioribacter sp. Ez-97]|uniref:GWxTD domain-containing protein n=1 Tax=Melioribacter sp. Ez-97 TaxID=3423434 RepID=UPI003EDA8472
MLKILATVLLLGLLDVACRKMVASEKFILKIAAILLLSATFALSRQPDSVTYYINLSRHYLDTGDTLSAEKLLEKSTERFEEPELYFLLGNLKSTKKDYSERNRAYRLLKKAALLEPGNLKYRLAYASILKDFARVSAYGEYKEILKLDPNSIEAYLKLAELKDEDFTNYNNSYRKLSDEFYASLQEYANEDFKEAEKYYLAVLSIDSINYEANYKLALLYMKAGEYEKAVSFLERIYRFKKQDAKINLSLGLCYYKLRKFKESGRFYIRGFRYMTPEERKEYDYESVVKMLQPVYDEIMGENEYKKKRFIKFYWDVNDPLYLTDYNERLLEHYSRITFANLFFDNDEKKGWQTDRGEVILRYGEPLNIMRIRPSMGEAGYEMKTDVWDYGQFSFGFTDMALSDNFIFSAPPADKEKVVSQYAFNSHEFIQYLRKSYYSRYAPLYEGNEFTMSHKEYYFKSFSDPSKTEMHFVFKMPDSLKSNRDSLNMKTGFFFFDEYHNKLEKIVKNRNYSAGGEVNEFIADLKPDSGYYSFEMIENNTGHTCVKRGKLNVPDFNKSLSLSSLVLADSVYFNDEGILNRRQYSINPHTVDTVGNKIFLYYEIYNLAKKRNGAVEFRQKIKITRNEEGTGIFSILKNLFSVSRSITLTNEYKTDNGDIPLFIRLDIKDLESGKYILEVEIEDLNAKKSVNSNLQFYISRRASNH